MRPLAKQEYLCQQFPCQSTQPSLHLPNSKPIFPHTLPHALPHNHHFAFLQWTHSTPTTLTLTIPNQTRPFCLSMQNQPQNVTLNRLLYIYSPQQLYAIDMSLNTYTLYVLPSCTSFVCLNQQQTQLEVVYTTARGIIKKIFSPLGDRTMTHNLPHLYIDLIYSDLALISTTANECQIYKLSTMTALFKITLPFKQNTLTRRIKCMRNKNESFILGISGNGQIEIIQFTVNTLQTQFTIHTEGKIILDFALLTHGLYYLCSEAIRKDPFCRYVPYTAPYIVTDVYLLQKQDSSFLIQQQYQLKQLFTTDHAYVIRTNSFSILCEATETLKCNNIYATYAGEDVLIEQPQPSLQFSRDSLQLREERESLKMCSNCDEYSLAINTYDALTSNNPIHSLPNLHPIDGPQTIFQPFLIARLKDIINYLSKCVNRHRLHFCFEKREAREHHTSVAKALYNLTTLLNYNTATNAYNKHSHSTLLARYFTKYPPNSNITQILKNILQFDPPNFIHFLQQQPQAFIKYAINQPLNQHGKFCLPLDNCSQDAYWTQLLLTNSVQTTHILKNPRLQLLCILNNHPQAQSITKDTSQALLRQLPQHTNAVLNCLIKQCSTHKRKGVKNSLSNKLQRQQNMLRTLCEQFKERCQQFKVFSTDIPIEKCDKSEINQAKKGLKTLLQNIEIHLKQFRTLYHQLYGTQHHQNGVHLKNKDQLMMENSFVESISLLNRILSQEWIDLLKAPINDPKFLLFYSQQSIFYFMLRNVEQYPYELRKSMIYGSQYTLQRIRNIVQSNSNLSAMWKDKLDSVNHLQ